MSGQDVSSHRSIGETVAFLIAYAPKKATGSEANRNRCLDRFVCVPEPLRSNDEWDRFWGCDLHRLSRPMLLRECQQIRHRLTLDDNPPPWFMLRLDWIEGKLQNE